MKIIHCNITVIKLTTKKDKPKFSKRAYKHETKQGTYYLVVKERRKGRRKRREKQRKQGTTSKNLNK